MQKNCPRIALNNENFKQKRKGINKRLKMFICLKRCHKMWYLLLQSSVHCINL